MKEEIYIKRLEQFASYLEEIEDSGEVQLGYSVFTHLHEGYRFTYGVLYHRWVLMYLSDLYPEFYLNEIGEVGYNFGGRSVDDLTGVYITFGIADPDELYAFLEAEGNQSCEKYGTRSLGRYSSAKDIAYNIRKVAEYKRNKLFQ